MQDIVWKGIHHSAMRNFAKDSVWEPEHAQSASVCTLHLKLLMDFQIPLLQGLHEQVPWNIIK